MKGGRGGREGGREGGGGGREREELKYFVCYSLVVVCLATTLSML